MKRNDVIKLTIMGMVAMLCLYKVVDTAAATNLNQTYSTGGGTCTDANDDGYCDEYKGTPCIKRAGTDICHIIPTDG